MDEYIDAFRWGSSSPRTCSWAAVYMAVRTLLLRHFLLKGGSAQIEGLEVIGEALAAAAGQ